MIKTDLSYGDVIRVPDFIRLVEYRCYTNYDGDGVWLDKHKEYISDLPSLATKTIEIPTGAEFVLWFNK